MQCGLGTGKVRPPRGGSSLNLSSPTPTLEKERILQGGSSRASPSQNHQSGRDQTLLEWMRACLFGSLQQFAAHPGMFFLAIRADDNLSSNHHNFPYSILITSISNLHHSFVVLQVTFGLRCSTLHPIGSLYRSVHYGLGRFPSIHDGSCVIWQIIGSESF